jgi:cytochrome c biogenesis protein CcmG/thiol:disulfide interchange protein DsbE
MMVTIKNGFMRVALLLMTAGVLAASLSAASRLAPDVTLKTDSGDAVHLSDYRGQVVLVDFWASWCVPCKTSFPALDALYREYHARGVEVLAVNLDERRRDADLFLDEFPHTIAVLFDPKGTSAEAFGVRGMPSSFIIDAEGVIRFTHIGYRAEVAASYRREIVQLLLAQHQP